LFRWEKRANSSKLTVLLLNSLMCGLGWAGFLA